MKIHVQEEIADGAKPKPKLNPGRWQDFLLVFFYKSKKVGL